MIVQNRSFGIGKAKTIKIRPVIGPERIYQAGSFQCRQSGVFMEV